MEKEILCLVGESGSGKTTIAEALEKAGFNQIQSYTTRAPRYKEEKGHIFVSKKQFNKLRPDLVAYTMFAEKEYGATKQQIEENDLYVIDTAGVRELARNIGRKNMYVVYLMTSVEERYRRLTESRTTQEAQDRIAHDVDAFYGFMDYDILLRNETEFDLKMNLKILTSVLEAMRTDENRRENHG